MNQVLATQGTFRLDLGFYNRANIKGKTKYQHDNISFPSRKLCIVLPLVPKMFTDIFTKTCSAPHLPV